LRRIGGFLGRSPFGPIYEQAVKAADCVAEVPALVEALARRDRAAALRVAERIRRAEHEADLIKSEIRDHLSGSLFSSVERSEVMLVVSLMDALPDDAEDLARLVMVRDTPAPGELGERLAGLARKAKEAADGVVSVAGMLRDLMERSGSRSECAELLARIASLGELGFAAEEAELGFLKRLFESERELGPVDIVVLMQMAARVAEIVKSAENVADAIRRMVLNR